jgi:L-alanine-DL-glutamate epimerase-like enolase superfamily enzyme
MKVTDIETMVLEIELAQPTWSAATLSPLSTSKSIATRAALVIRVSTDEGLVGIGQAHAGGGLIAPVRTAIEQVIQPYVVGQDPFMVESIWDKVYQGTFLNGRKGVIIAALSGVDVALWDIMGKAAGQPVYKLLGACRDKALGYATGGFYAPGKTVAALADEISGYAARGFKAAKIKLGLMSVKEDMQRARAVREAVGDGMRLMADANRSYDVKTAIRVARQLEELGYEWLEEPICPDDVEGSTLVTASTSIAIAGYETENTSRGFRDLIARRAVDVVQTDLIWNGGFTECRKIAAIANAWNMPVVPHAYASAVPIVAGLHLVGSAPNASLMELDQTPNPLISELFTERFDIDADGYVAIPTKPGLGVELNEEAIRRYRVG